MTLRVESSGDHHWVNLPGYVTQFMHEWDRGDGTHGLPLQEQALLMHLSCFRFGENGIIKPSISAIMERMGVSRSTANRYIKSANEAGWLAIESGKDAGKTSVYNYSALERFCRQRANETGWFDGYANPDTPGMPTLTHEYIEVNKKEKESMSAGADGDHEPKPEPPVHKKSPEADKRYDDIAYAIMEHVHGLKDVPKSKAYLWRTVRRQAQEAAAYEWMTATSIHAFTVWFQRKHDNAALPSSIEKFSEWITKYAAARAGSPSGSAIDEYLAGLPGEAVGDD